MCGERPCSCADTQFYEEVRMRSTHANARRLATTAALAVLAGVFASVADGQIADSSFVLVAPVTFQMGSRDFRPIHRVEISHGFLMQKTEVTQAQWTAVM